MIFALIAYAVAMIAANLLVATFGPSVTAINAFLLIGLDLTLRDWLHFRLKTWQMGCLELTKIQEHRTSEARIYRLREFSHCQIWYYKRGDYCGKTKRGDYCGK